MGYNKKTVSTVNDDPCEGKPFIFPQCVSCVYCEEGFCKAFNEERLVLVAGRKVDLTNCPKYKSEY